MSSASHAAHEQMEAFFIGPAANQLFACNHPAQGQANSLRFVLSAALGQEAIQFQRPLRLLARQVLGGDGSPPFPRYPQGYLHKRLENLGALISLPDHENEQLWAWKEDFAKVNIRRKTLGAIRAWAQELPS